MVENSTIFRTATFSYNMAYYLVFLAHIPLLKTEKQNALFAPSMILSALFSSTLPCHQNFGLELCAPPHICSIFVPPNPTKLPLHTTLFSYVTQTIPNFVCLAVYVFPTPYLPPPINFLHALYLVSFLAILMNTKDIAVWILFPVVFTSLGMSFF
jgi:hypothetical protein